MTKPQTLRNLKEGGYIGLHEIETIARQLFDGKITVSGVEGYIVTLAHFDDLPESAQSFIRKAVLASTVENILDVESVDDGEGFDPYWSSDDETG